MRLRLSPESIGNGPFERTGGEARNLVQQGLPDEAPRGARKSTRPASDGQHIQNRDDIGVVRRGAFTDSVDKEAVSVGRRVNTDPDSHNRNVCDVNHNKPARGKLSEMRGDSRPDRVRSNRSGQPRKVDDFDCLYGTFEGYRLPCRRG